MRSVCSDPSGPLESIHDWVKGYERMWTERFDRLDQVLEEMKQAKRRVASASRQRERRVASASRQRERRVASASRQREKEEADGGSN